MPLHWFCRTVRAEKRLSPLLVPCLRWPSKRVSSTGGCDVALDHRDKQDWLSSHWSPTLKRAGCSILSVHTGCASAGPHGLGSQKPSLKYPAFSLLKVECWISPGENWNVYSRRIWVKLLHLFLIFSRKPFNKSCKVNQFSVFFQQLHLCRLAYSRNYGNQGFF